MMVTIDKGFRLLLAGTLIVNSVSSAFGANMAGRRGDQVTGKLSAPTQEEHADYFAVSRKEISLEDQRRADDLRLKTIASIRKLLDERSEKSGRHFELILRLGELYVERHDYMRDVELSEYTRLFAEWEKKPKDKRGKEPELTYKKSTAELTKAANSFRKLVNEYPKHPRTDAALYSLAKTLGRLGNDNAVQYYKQLIGSHPNSSLIPDAYLAMGEFYFDKHQIPQAISAYKSAMKFKDHPAYAYSVYKLGWAHYNASASNDDETKENSKKAVAAFKLVVRLADKEKEKAQEQKNSRNLNLREEAIKDLVMVWAEAEDVESAWAYFKTIGEQDSFYTMLERLGWIYSEQGKNEKAIAVYQRLLRESPKRPNNPKIYAQMVELQDLTNQTQDVVASLQEMQRLYTGSTAWTMANRANAKAMEDADRILEFNLHRYGTLYHNRGQKAKSKSYLSAAATIYSTYLTSFEKNANAYDVRFYLAEILFDFNKYEQASKHYMIVAKAEPKGGKYTKQAAVNGVSAMNKLVAETKFDKVPPPGQVTKPLEIPRVKKKLVEVIDDYLVLLPHEQDGHGMRFTAAQVFFDYGQYPEATERFEKIVAELPGTKQAHASARILIAFHADKEQWDAVITQGKKFASSKPLMANADLRKYVEDIVRLATFNRAKAFERDKQYEKAGVAFLAFQKEYTKDTNADRALYNASVNFQKAGKLEDSIGATKALLEQYPKSELRPDVMATLAETFETVAQFESAANYYRMFAASYPNDKRAAGAMYNSAVLYKGLNNYDLAMATFRAFVKSYPKHALSGDALMELAGVQERSGRFREASESYAAYASLKSGERERSLYAAAKSGEILMIKLGDHRGRKELERLRVTLSAKNAPPAFEARQIVANALFKTIDPGFSEFKSLLVNNGAQIEKQIKRKQEKLEQLASGYESVIGLASAEFTVASLFRLGEMHEDFANALFKAPGPAGATQADLDQFKTQLEKLAFPLKEEANKFYEAAYKRSQEVETFTPWTRRTYQKMVELQPQKYPEVDEQSIEPSFLAHRVSLNDATRGLTE